MIQTSKLKKLLVILTLVATLFSITLLTPSPAKADFSPASVGNIQLWLDATAGATTDGTTPATDGQTVQQWNDQSGTGHNATQLSGANKPTYKTNIFNGQPALRFAGNQTIVTSSFLDSSYDTTYTFFLVGNKANANIEVATSNQGVTWYSGRTDSQIFNTNNLTDASIGSTGANTRLGIEVFKYNGTTKTSRFNAYQLTESATGNMGLSGALTIGNLSGGGFAYNGDIAEVIIYKSALSGPDITSVEQYLASKYGINHPQIVFDGDSMTFGQGSTGGNSYPNQTLALLGGSSSWQSYNYGVSGQTVAQMDADGTTQIDPVYSSLSTGNILALLGGTNDLYFGASAATTYSNIVAYSNHRRSAGYKVIVSTILPRSDVSTPGTFEADRQTVNTNLRNNWATFADGLADVAADSRIGDAGDQTDATYYVDLVHPTNAGYAIIAGIMKAQVDLLYDGTPPTVSITAPSNTATVSGASVSITANASDNTGVAGVQFKRDTSTNIGAEDVTSTYGVTWDTTAVADGAHTLTAVARDAAGNTTTSAVVNVTVDNTAPVRSAGAPSGTLAVDTTSTSISLSTNETATCKYSTSPGTAYGSMTIFTSTANTTHSTTVSGLANGGSYNYYVKCSDAQGNINAADYTISFSIGSDVTPPIISSIAAAPSSTGGTITWSTNEASNSQVNYGLTSGYGTSTVLNATLTTSHSETLSGLAPGTLYHYRVVSRDAALNSTSSSDQTFTTATSGAITGGGGGQQIPSGSGSGSSSSHPSGSLLLEGQTVFLIQDGQRCGFRNQAEYESYGYNLGQVVKSTPSDNALTFDCILKAMAGTLVLDSSDNRTVYLIGTGYTKRGFTSAAVFTALGYASQKLVKIDLTDYPVGDPITSAVQAHPDGSLVLDGNTVWWIRSNQRLGFESEAVFKTYGFSFKKVVKANAADLALAEGPQVKLRDGTLVRDGADYYIISSGKKMHFSSSDQLTKNGYNLTNVVTADLSKYELGGQVQ